MTRKRILIFGPYFPYGGPTFHIRNFAKYLSLTNNLKIFSVYGEKKINLMKENFSVIQYPYYFRNSKLIQASLLNLIYALKNQKHFDLLHVQNPTTFFCLKASFISKPIILTTHGIVSLENLISKRIKKDSIQHLLLERIEKFTYEKADFIICVHKELYDYLNRKFYISRDRVSIIPNGVDTNIFKPNEINRITIRKKLGIKPDDYLISCFKTGHLDGFEYILEAFSRINHNGKIKLLISKKDPTVNYLKIIKKYNLEGKCIIQENISYEQMPFYYNASDINVIQSYLSYKLGKMITKNPPKSIKEMCSQGYAVTTNLTAMESFSSKVPTIFGIPNVKFSVLKNDIGMMIPAWEPNQLKNAIEYLLSDKSLRENIGQQARTYVMENFTWDKLSKRINNVYDKILSK
jgi:glycosyltransferase involved in cell wall biosynthesis